ncbi:TetR/AcrR family transcriptional regulator [Actinoplanes sp. NPDC051859]|uniref:TetR/AcrR family transcriptional regulator n=1 Tax=Actinoplanes sp. NPDC051859 TaxID=3363909 RepID=UPI0037874FFA
MTTDTPPRRRDATGTQRLLLDAARQRFAAHGYAATTVREIADDAGVNVALINRYFDSKEGLFKACLVGAADEIDRSVRDQVTVDQIPAAIAAQITGNRDGLPPTRLLLLLRSSGNERADQIRRDVLHTFAVRLATVAGWQPGDDQLLLRAEMLLSAVLGITLLRYSTGLEPLTAATEQDLIAPLRDLTEALLRNPPMPR